MPRDEFRPWALFFGLLSPSMEKIAFTRWPSIYNIDAHDPQTESWVTLTSALSSYVRVRRKDLAPGFGPYTLKAPWVACFKHVDGLPRAEAHRCAQCIDRVTLLVFDADRGSAEDRKRCDDLLAADGLARHWYSTYSHRPDRPAFRLVVPLAAPVHPDHFSILRSEFFGRYHIPADPKQCSSPVHFYYLPSCPSWATPEVYSFAGKPFDPKPFLEFIPLRAETPKPDLSKWSPPRGTTPGAAEYRARLESKYQRLSRQFGREEKALLLRRCLDGVALAEHGRRNVSALVLTGLLAYELPDATTDELLTLVRPSLDAMIAAGSKLTEAVVEGMIVRAQRAKAADGEVQREIERQVFERHKRELEALGLGGGLAADVGAGGGAGPKGDA